MMSGQWCLGHLRRPYGDTGLTFIAYGTTGAYHRADATVASGAHDAEHRLFLLEA